MSEATILKALLAVVAVAQVGNGMPIPAHDSNLDQRFPPALPTSNNVEGVFSAVGENPDHFDHAGSLPSPAFVGILCFVAALILWLCQPFYEAACKKFMAPRPSPPEEHQMVASSQTPTNPNRPASDVTAPGASVDAVPVPRASNVAPVIDNDPVLSAPAPVSL